MPLTNLDALLLAYSRVFNSDKDDLLNRYADWARAMALMIKTKLGPDLKRFGWWQGVLSDSFEEYASPEINFAYGWDIDLPETDEEKRQYQACLQAIQKIADHEVFQHAFGTNTYVFVNDEEVQSLTTSEARGL